MQANPRPCGSQWWESFCSRKEGDRQQARRASLRNSHIFPAASGDRGGPPARPPTFYLPALTPWSRAREGDRRAAAVQP